MISFFLTGKWSNDPTRFYCCEVSEFPTGRPVYNVLSSKGVVSSYDAADLRLAALLNVEQIIYSPETYM